MKQNVAGQFIGAQMVSATDGSAFTGAVTVYVTGDAGTQAAGSVGAGACAHEGNGFHTYAPAQAETNYAHIGFTFIGTGAVPATVQVYTMFPQTGDNFARLGAPAGASVSADVAAVKAVLPAALVSGRIDASVGAMAANVMTAAAAAADLTTELQAGLSTLDAAGVRSAVGLASANLDTQLTAIDDFIDTEVSAIKTKTDFLPSATAGAAGGLFIAGSNAATSITTALTANIIGNVTGNLSGSVGSVTGAVGSVTGAVGSVTGLTAANLDVAVSTRASQTSVDDLPTNAELATALGTADDAVLAQVATANAVLAKLDDTLEDAGTDGFIFSAVALSQAPTGGTAPTVTEIADEVQTRTIAAVTVVNGLAGNVITAAATAADFTTEIQTGLATAAALTVVDDFLDTEVGTLVSNVAALKEYADNTVCRGTVSATAPTTTSFTTSALAPAGVAADQFKGRIIIFDTDTTTTALRGQATDITASSAAGNPLLTFTALTTAPQSGDTFSIV